MSRPPDPTRRPQLLEQIVTYLGENGVADLTLRELADGLGVSTTVLTYHFGNKRQLIDAAVDLAERRMRDVAREGLVHGLGEALRRYWAWVLDPEAMQQLGVALEAAVLRTARHEPGPEPSMMNMWIEMFSSELIAHGMNSTRATSEASLIHGALLGLCMDVWDSGDVARTTASLEALAEYADAASASARASLGAD